MQPACGRRRCLALVAGLLVSAGVAQPAWARPGFPAKYAYARPMYLRGRLVSREDTLPYVRLTVDVPRDGTHPPQDREWMRPLEDAEARPTLTALVPLDRTGRLTLTLDWRLSRALLDDTSLLAVGARRRMNTAANCWPCCCGGPETRCWSIPVRPQAGALCRYRRPYRLRDRYRPLPRRQEGRKLRARARPQKARQGKALQGNAPCAVILRAGMLPQARSIDADHAV